MLASLIDVSHLVETWGYPILFLLVMAESGGVPVPGETAIIVGGVLASQGKLQIELVIAIAALAAIVGDNIGYQIGRKGGRWLLERPGPFQRHRLAVLRTGEPFFEQHGPKAVFFGRFILGLRTWASWLAGANHRRWRTFFLWNALGGICWATAVGLIAYFVGQSASNAIATFGIFGLVAVVLALGGGLALHLRHRRHERIRLEAEAARESSAREGSAQERPAKESSAQEGSARENSAREGSAKERSALDGAAASARGDAVPELGKRA
jgi:membrane protein DedA with SNARE-associated domain